MKHFLVMKVHIVIMGLQEEKTIIVGEAYHHNFKIYLYLLFTITVRIIIIIVIIIILI